MNDGTPRGLLRGAFARPPVRRLVGALVLGLFVAAGVFLGRFLANRKELDIAGPLHELEIRIAQKHRADWVKRVHETCERRNCACALEAVRTGLDAGAGAESLAVLDVAARGCPELSLDGLRAEALVHMGRDSDGKREAERALALTKNDAHAAYALALASYHAQSLDSAATLARRAMDFGRGSAALSLVGLIAFQRADFEGASAAFRKVEALDAADVDAKYNLALVAQKRGRYGEARNGYLAVTRLDPEQREARYNLAVLAHSAGAVDEAQHHLRKLREIAPDDARVRDLEAVLAVPPELPDGGVLTLGSPAPAGSARREAR